ncbi:hypothetical protein RUM43_001124 [Polyplax serrata]|uniref:Nondiscriminating glutamyl-tRNA synthetase EARS2, mitochondrial n=1 Tax=Polyplax serrata TaxID=468196 RepID=A0AAN8SHD4_POLSC
MHFAELREDKQIIIGLLHLGGLRTALYNHLFAKSRNGVTILRIEDTDQIRKVDSSVESLIEDLAWCGIKFDEGPYYQSERIELYKKYGQQLVEEGKAYYCFCTKMRLELLKREAQKSGEIHKYDNACRHLTQKDIDEKLGKGEIPCIRFKLSSIKEEIMDLIQNSYVSDIASSEGDPVIMKADGFPTYHFANVIDDHLMNITHVLRGVEWQLSTSKHILLYRALNWKPPIYGHFPLLLNSDGTKLSKRQGDVHICGLRKEGYFPNAILNFIIRYGGGFDIQQKEKDIKIFTMDELYKKFNISRIKQASSRISMDKLVDYNNLEIMRLTHSSEGMDELVMLVQEAINKAHKERRINGDINLTPENIKIIIQRLKGRFSRVEDIVSEKFDFLWVWNNKFTFAKNEDIDIMEKFLLESDGIEWNIDELKKFINEFSRRDGQNFSHLMQLFRIVLIERKSGPSIPEILDLLGKDSVHGRIKNAIIKSKNNHNGVKEIADG